MANVNDSSANSVVMVSGLAKFRNVQMKALKGLQNPSHTGTCLYMHSFAHRSDCQLPTITTWELVMGHYVVL